MKKEFFRIAAKEAHKSEYFMKVGCVLEYKHQILSEGYNKQKSHPLQMKLNKRLENPKSYNENHTQHAEVNAIIQCLDDPDINWEKVTLYTYRPKNSKEFGLARPCPRCMTLIKSLGIKHICYTTEDGYAEEFLLK